uniref:TSA: Wollemia nobilis Ref_Wollemi_Transcript_1150_1464 transcribed RNA sequence n=1 Tax=Wollemia nobilis TaxID=56998 RepID=A0A0C9RZ72_9CONI
MAEEKLRFGILGCAEIARKVSRSIELAPNASVYAVSSRSLDKAKAFVSANNLPSQVVVYDSYEMLLEDPSVDAVYMPLPTSLHLHWAIKAAQMKKHILLEKPPAISVDELDKIIEACNNNGVQLMDGTMWMHHPRTPHMKAFLQNTDLFGDLKTVHSTFTVPGSEDFLENDIRVKPDLDAHGALGDVGWYCIRAILWANDYQMPHSVIAHPGPVLNISGVIMACGATLFWQDGRVATFYCSFLADLCMDFSVHGSKGTLRLHDFVIPYEESSASYFCSSNCKFGEKHTYWGPNLSEHIVKAELPQDALMVQEFSRLVKSIRDSGGKPDPYWPSVSRKTQMVLNAMKTSIQEGLISVTL